MDDALRILGDQAGDAMAYFGHRINFISFPISNGTKFNFVAFKLDDEPWTHTEWKELVSRETMLADFENDVDKPIVKISDVQMNFTNHKTPTC